MQELYAMNTIIARPTLLIRLPADSLPLLLSSTSGYNNFFFFFPLRKRKQQQQQKGRDPEENGTVGRDSEFEVDVHNIVHIKTGLIFCQTGAGKNPGPSHTHSISTTRYITEK